MVTLKHFRLSGGYWLLSWDIDGILSLPAWVRLKPNNFSTTKCYLTAAVKGTSI